MTRLLLIIFVFLLVSCQKESRIAPEPEIVTANFKLLQVIDSVVSIPKVKKRTTYYYAPTGLCDSSLHETQVSSPPDPPAFSRIIFRYEYNATGKVTLIYRRDMGNPEILFAEAQYDATGKKVFLRVGTETHKYVYDGLARMVKDSIFSSFGYWTQALHYAYDANDNMIVYKTFSRYSTDSGVEVHTYDNAINPLQKEWNLVNGSGPVFSKNNLASTSAPILLQTITYQYNADNLPVKALLFTGAPEPTVRTYVYE